MKKLRERIATLTKAQKTEIIVAAVLTLAILAGVPALAWLTTVTKVEVLTKIKEPDNLDIRAGNGDPVINIDLRDIDINKPDHTDPEQNKASKYYVFSVSTGDYKIPYVIQVAHTTNIPFTYKLFAADRLSDDATPAGLFAVYHPVGEPENKTNYAIKGNNLLVNTRNPDNADVGRYGRVLGLDNDNYYHKTYADGDAPQLYAIPLYHQTDTISWSEGSGNGPDYYVLEMEWDKEVSDTEGFTQWNKAENNKETDIIYISAAKATN